MFSLFKQLQQHKTVSAAQQQHNQHLAIAMLMLEVARADFSIDASEREYLLAMLQERLGLTTAERDQLLEYAEQKSEEAIEMHSNIRVLNETFDREEKLQMIEDLWAMALADGVLDKYEEHVIGKLSDLLYVPRSDVIRLREKVKDKV